MKLRSAYSWMLFASMYPARCSALQMDAMLNPNRAKSPKTAPGLPEAKNIKFEYGIDHFFNGNISAARNLDFRPLGPVGFPSSPKLVL